MASQVEVGGEVGRRGRKSSSTLSQEATVESLTIWEKMDFIPAFSTSLFKAFIAAITAPFVAREKKPPTYLRYVAYTLMRTLTSRTSGRQQHLLANSTDKSYEEFCNKFKLKPEWEILDDGTRANWIGKRDARKIILNFHGGGYCLPASPTMFEFYYSVVKELNEKNGNEEIACLFLSYDLAPTSPYPRQLQQSILILTHLIQTLLIPPKNIIITGDSSGSHLALGLLSHVTHPNPDPTLPPLPSLLSTSKIGGTILISAWVTFSTHFKSYDTNEKKDFLSKYNLGAWGKEFLASGTIKQDGWNEPGLNDTKWWKDLPVENVLVTAGEDEVLVDSIDEFVGKFKGEGGFEGEVEYVKLKGECHEQCLLDVQLLYPEGDGGRVIKSWIGKVFSG